jgi:hypothetical protein
MKKLLEKTVILLLVCISLAFGLSSCGVVVFGYSQLLAIVNSLNYGYYSYESGTLPVTQDIMIVGSITISSEEVEAPAGCSNMDYCRPLVGFKDSYGAEGIEFTPYSSEDHPPGSLTLTNVVVRLRPLVINEGGPPPGPSGYMKYPVIQILPPTDHECEDTQIRCDADQVCYDYYSRYCRHCLTLSQEECVCRDENGIFDEGTYCIVTTGDDTYYSGECQDGICEEVEW